jgi:hypothetical protein
MTDFRVSMSPKQLSSTSKEPINSGQFLTLELEKAWLEHLDDTMRCAIVVFKWSTAFSFSAPRILVQKKWLCFVLCLQKSPMLSRTELSDILSCSGDTIRI